MLVRVYVCRTGLLGKNRRTVCLSVCVIGAGSSGLTSIKSFLTEGLETTCFSAVVTSGGCQKEAQGNKFVLMK
uniref:Flavin-containing monooxygenase n=1 Tax=Oncorhynchus kisutch TaxID=8019 RepID=A0A8C7FRX8_ONCKI